MSEPIKETTGRSFRERLRHFRRERVQKWLETYTWPAIAGLWALTFLLGYVGFRKYFAGVGEFRSSWDIVYLTLQLFTVESGSVPGKLSWELEAARLLAPAMTLYTAVQALAMIFHEQLQRLRARFYRNHIVICGLGRRGLLLARAFRAMGEKVVVIEHDDDNDRIEQCREHGAIVLIGNAFDREVLKEARLEAASHVIAMCGDDGVNAEVAVDARELAATRREWPLTCIVQIVDPHLLQLLTGRELGMRKDDSFRLEFFNVFERGARTILNEYPPFSGEIGEAPHLLVVGIGRMGESLVAHAARSWRNRPRDDGGRLTVTLIDRHGQGKREYLSFRYPLLEKLCDLRAYDMDVTSPEFHLAEFLFDSPDCGDVTAIYVCLDDDTRCMAAALALLQHTRGREIPVVVRMTNRGGLAVLLQGDDEGREGKGGLKPFGLLERTCTPEVVLGGAHETLARGVHEDYVRRFASSAPNTRTNDAMAPWGRLPEELRDSFRRQADQTARKLMAVRCAIEPLTEWDAELFEFNPEEIELIARMDHDYYVRELRGRRRVYFPGREDPGRDGVPFASWVELSEDVKESYRNMARELPHFLARFDFQIHRLK